MDRLSIKLNCPSPTCPDDLFSPRCQSEINVNFVLLFFQVLEQEKHNLRQKLLLAESDGDVRVLELQADLKEFQGKLDVQEQNVRQAEREKTLLIEELTSQNARLTLQLQEANQLEAQLNVQLQEIRDQYSLRSNSLQVCDGIFKRPRSLGKLLLNSHKFIAAVSALYCLGGIWKNLF